MKDYYNETETTQVYGYGYTVQQGSGIFSTLFKKAADVFTKKALEEGSKILVDKATKKTGELVNKYLGGDEKKPVPTEEPVVLKESKKKQTKMSKEELRQMREALARIKKRQMIQLRKLQKEEDGEEDDEDED